MSVKAWVDEVTERFARMRHSKSWNCVTCKHMWNGAEESTLKCIYCDEGSNYTEQTERSE